MSKADKMFEELGYIEHFINYWKDEIYSKDQSHGLGKTIEFNKDKTIHVYPERIDMQELKAINKKCEELGWI